MKKWFIILSFLLLLFPANVKASDYILNVGDAININIFGYPEMELKEITVRSDGKVSFPPIGDVMAKGLSPEQLSAAITERMKSYLNSPVITVNVLKFRTTKVYVLGEVTNPGKYDLESSHDLLDALSMAKGWTKEAAKTKVFIIRKGSKGEPLRVNLLDILNKGDTTKNCTLNDGDIVYLTGNHRIDISRDIMPYVTLGYYLRN